MSAALLLRDNRSRARHALDRLAARPPRQRKRRLEPPEFLHHGVEDLGGEVAEEGPEDVAVAVAAELGLNPGVHIFLARVEVRYGVGGREARRS